jgi:hypothetical protein
MAYFKKLKQEAVCSNKTLTAYWFLSKIEFNPGII